MKKGMGLFLAFLLVLGLTACSEQGQSTEKKSSDHQKTAEKSSTKTANQVFPVTIKDAAGKQVTLKEKPKRIVSLIPSDTEITFALGAGKRVVGVSKFDNYPKAVQSIAKIGGIDFNIEKIISLKPDLVLAYATQIKNKAAGLNQLRKAGIPVLVVNESSNFEDVYHSINMIAKATGTRKKASEIINHMKDSFAKIKKKAASIPNDQRVKVYVEISAPPNIYTAGSGTFVNQMLNLLNAKNIAASEKGWPKYSSEKVVKQDPDVIVLTYGAFTKNAVQKVLNRSGWQNVNAVQNKRVYNVDGDLVTRPGPRLVKGVEQLAHAIYPNVYTK
ncbi:MAG TPA: ABC transporter substrate-binding protein [Bacillales bacterium]|nr:ABC transporter substrate-binding protein [Bacillales bacterium]